MMVYNDREFSEPTEVTNGAKQGCVMASTLFIMMLSAMLIDTFQDRDNFFPPVTSLLASYST